jgi:MscS family membrane protein
VFLISALGISLSHSLIASAVNKTYSHKNYNVLRVFLKSLRAPLKYFILLATAASSLEMLESSHALISVYRSHFYVAMDFMLIFIMTWLFFRMSNNFKESVISDIRTRAERLSDDSEKALSHKTNAKYRITSLDAGFKLLNFAIILISLLAVFQQIGLSLSGLMAFGGMSGIIVGFASKDFLANLFGGIMIYFNRPFDIGDWVRSPDRDIEGFVEQIGWLVTQVRRFDKRPIYIPNAIFSIVSLENPSRMTHRRFHQSFYVQSASAEALPVVTRQIKQMLVEHNGVVDGMSVIVAVNGFHGSQLEIVVRFFTNTVKIESYHSIKQDVLLKIYHVFKEHDIAMPETRSEILLRDPSLL